MGAVELVGVAASLSFLAGWRLYACIAAAGLAMRYGLIDLPQKIQALDALANPWVIGVALLGATAELFADKVMWFDSLWDGAHTLIRPLGGALLALAVVDASDPAWQVVVFMLGGGAALLSHSAKASARAAVNTSPEPVSNIAVSGFEDVVTAGGLWLVLSQPHIAIAVALVLLICSLGVIYMSWRVLRRLRRWWSSDPSP
ncbi:hypothetical protein ASE17_03975 [Phenylobacterium sp. Root77]|jgi:hypothetical protein|uniref:DUF4126 domain-containing protein n=1 Tax=unclassified Phenylobacterium TaxID=2640670 RepID=UPI0006FBB0BB|nr:MULTISPECIES: DUF4126 domain-containing protein [unclassified Phenylobacterium]KQW72036.1 hypothetical protein ASC73_08200 [Phenylobacterium sp. Root1277]KQW94957.1 hypothetical protein ASC79_04345 [Phenylobacterium sp. Root1290]KRC44651.1 hypothetical protein ASE17_03975 [Phenylobacterium sp. Root77]